MVSGCLARIVYSDVRHNFLPHYAAAAGVLLVTPVIFGLAELTAQMSAQPLEMMPLLMGIILFTPILAPEQNECILETVRAKKMSRHIVTGMRLLCSFVLLAVLIFALGGYMWYNECDVSVKMCAGALAGAFAVGALGFFCAAVTDNVIVGYMVSLMYAVMNLFLRKELGKFFLMSMTFGIKGCKPVLAVSGAVLIIAAMIYRRFAKNER